MNGGNFQRESWSALAAFCSPSSALIWDASSEESCCSQPHLCVLQQLTSVLHPTHQHPLESSSSPRQSWCLKVKAFARGEGREGTHKGSPESRADVQPFLWAALTDWWKNTPEKKEDGSWSGCLNNVSFCGWQRLCSKQTAFCCRKSTLVADDALTRQTTVWTESCSLFVPGTVRLSTP